MIPSTMKNICCPIGPSAELCMYTRVDEAENNAITATIMRVMYNPQNVRSIFCKFNFMLQISYSVHELLAAVFVGFEQIERSAAG